MGTYDYNSPGGPRIDTGLMINARTQGAAVSREIPGVVTSIWEGAKEGIETAQTIELNRQKIETNDLALEEARRLEERRASTEEIDDETATLEAENKKAEALKQQQLNDLYNQFTKVQQSGDINAYTQAVLSGQFSPLFQASPAIAERALKDTFAKWPQQNQNAYLDAVGKNRRQIEYEKQFQKAEQNYEKNFSDFETNKTTREILAQNDTYSSLDLLNKGKLVSVKPIMDDDGFYTSETGLKTLDPPKPTWNFVLNDGTVLKENVDSDFMTDFGNTLSSYNYKYKLYPGMDGETDLINQAKAEKEAQKKQREEQERVQSNILSARGAPTPPSPTPSSTPYAPNTLEGRYALKQQEMKDKIAKMKSSQSSSGAVVGNPTPLPNPTPTPTELEGDIPVKKSNIKLSPFLESYDPITQAVSLTENEPQDNTLVSRNKKTGKPIAYGLMQVIPTTFNDVVKKYGLENRDINNPADNVEVGALYLAEQIQLWGAEPGNGLEFALASYNGGPKWVQAAFERSEDKTWEGTKEVLKGILKPEAYEEMTKYVDKVMRNLVKIQKSNLVV